MEKILSLVLNKSSSVVVKIQKKQHMLAIKSGYTRLWSKVFSLVRLIVNNGTKKIQYFGSYKKYKSSLPQLLRGLNIKFSILRARMYMYSVYFKMCRRGDHLGINYRSIIGEKLQTFVYFTLLQALIIGFQTLFVFCECVIMRPLQFWFSFVQA